MGGSCFLIGGFNPFEKYYSQNLESSPNRGEHKQYLKLETTNQFWIFWDFLDHKKKTNPKTEAPRITTNPIQQIVMAGQPTFIGGPPSV